MPHIHAASLDPTAGFAQARQMAAESGDLLGRCRAEMAIGRAHAARGAHASAQAALEAARAALMKSSQLMRLAKAVSEGVTSSSNNVDDAFCEGARFGAPMVLRNDGASDLGVNVLDKSSSSEWSAESVVAAR